MDQKITRVALTPSFAPYKIVLLALVAAYCAGILPKKTHRPLLATIVKYIEGPSASHDTRTSVNVPTLDEILASMKESCLKVDSVEGYKYANDIELRLLHALWSLKTLDSLHTFVSRGRSLLVQNIRQGKIIMHHMSPKNSAPQYLLTRSSFLGKFVANCIAEFEALEFDKTELLWSSFINFRKSSKSSWMKQNSEKLPDVHDFFGTSDKGDDFSHLTSLFKQLPLNESYPKEEVLLISQEDLSKLIDHQVHIFETYGTATSPELRKTLNLMTQAETGKLPAIHYIRYLECLRDADYEGAFNSLHCYFDYMMSNRRTVFYHYALLCLATLHAAFDCEGEAIRAIEEAISVARENKDFACLNFVLSWLFNFMKDRPNLKHNFYVSSAQLLQFLKARTGETSSLHSTAYQSEATQIMLEGGSISSVLESLTKAAYISLTEDSSLISFISHCALASTFWFRVGNYELAHTYCDISLEASTSISQKVSVLIRKASMEYSIGNVEEAFKILEEQKISVASDLRLSKELVSHKLLLLSQQCIKSSRYRMAQYYLEKLEAQNHVNIDIQSELQYLTAYLHLKLGNNHHAFQIVSNQVSTFAKKSSNTYWFLKFSLLHCEIIGQSSAPARALSLSIKCFDIASKSGYTLLVLDSVLKIGEILKKLDQSEDLKVLLNDCVPYFEQISDLELKSKAHQMIADNLITLYKSQEDDRQKKIQHITKIVEHLEKAIDGFKKISMYEEMKKSLELQIVIAQKINHEDLLNHAQKSLVSINKKIQEELTVQS